MTCNFLIKFSSKVQFRSVSLLIENKRGSSNPEKIKQRRILMWVKITFLHQENQAKTGFFTRYPIKA